MKSWQNGRHIVCPSSPNEKRKKKTLFAFVLSRNIKSELVPCGFLPWHSRFILELIIISSTHVGKFSELLLGEEGCGAVTAPVHPKGGQWR